MDVPQLRRQGVEAVLAAGGRVPVTGGCMAPTVPAGASVLVEPCGPARLAPGDVVLLEHEGSFFLHRYLAMMHVGARVHILAKADRALRPDRPWPPGSLLGRLVRILDGPTSRPYRPGRLDRLLAAALGLAWLLALAFSGKMRGLLCPRPRRRG